MTANIDPHWRQNVAAPVSTDFDASVTGEKNCHRATFCRQCGRAITLCLHEAIVAATVGAIVAPTGCGDSCRNLSANSRLYVNQK